MPTSTIAVTTGVGPRIRLHSGGWLDLLSPETSEFTIEDIAHGLAHTCRYAGQADGFYSVAEHSLLVSAVAVGHEYTGLMHDAAEAFIGDVTRPLKQLLPEYRRIEARMEEAIFARFDVAPASAAIKSADLRVLAAEQAQIRRVRTAGPTMPASSPRRCRSADWPRKRRRGGSSPGTRN
jgi:hypothetical protein